MIYFDEKGVAIMGKHGFIGNALSKKDLPKGVYFFSSPSSIVAFQKDTDLAMKETLNEFIDVISYCKRTKTPLIFPSSATVYNKNTAYARCKAAIEEIYHAYDYPALCLRIAAGYGPGEAHKGDSASVVYQWCHQMMRGERPVIFGDGTQTRDFIYETDIADNIEEMAHMYRNTGAIVDLGTGIETSFNDVVATINKVLGTDIKPIYVDKPKNYVEATPVKAARCKVSLEEGIKHIING